MVGGIQVTPANREDLEHFEHGIVTTWFGMPVVAAQWIQRYVFETPPHGPIGVPLTPFYE